MTTPEHEGRPSRAAAIRLAALILSCAAALLCVAVAARSVEGPRKTKFDEGPLRTLDRTKPVYVLLGNSMVNTRFDGSTLREELAVPTQLIAYPATASAHWFLFMKNYVSAAQHKPKRVFVFFRDRELTEPRYRVDLDGPKLQRHSHDSEPLLLEKLAPEGPLGKVSQRISNYIPLKNLRPLVSERMSDFAMGVSQLLHAHDDDDEREELIEGAFELSKLRARSEGEAEAQIDDEEFRVVLPRSLLPDILAIAKQQGVPMTFIRVRRRRTAEGVPDAPELEIYLRELRRYLEAQGAEFYDMKDAAWERPSLYAQGDHIAARHRRNYTRSFVEHMRHVFH